MAWCEAGYDEQCELFASLREVDPRFTTKIHASSRSYVGRRDPAVKALVAAQQDLVKDYAVGVKAYISQRENAAVAKAAVVIERAKARPRGDDERIMLPVRRERPGNAEEEQERLDASWLRNMRRERCVRYPAVTDMLDAAFGARWLSIDIEQEATALDKARAIVRRAESRPRAPDGFLARPRNKPHNATPQRAQEGKDAAFMTSMRMAKEPSYQGNSRYYESVGQVFTRAFGPQWSALQKTVVKAEVRVVGFERWARANGCRRPSKTPDKTSSPIEYATERELAAWFSIRCLIEKGSLKGSNPDAVRAILTNLYGQRWYEGPRPSRRQDVVPA
jgi:hypothetical protein